MSYGFKLTRILKSLIPKSHSQTLINASEERKNIHWWLVSFTVTVLRFT